MDQEDHAEERPRLENITEEPPTPTIPVREHDIQVSHIASQFDNFTLSDKKVRSDPQEMSPEHCMRRDSNDLFSRPKPADQPDRKEIQLILYLRHSRRSPKTVTTNAFSTV